MALLSNLYPGIKGAQGIQGTTGAQGTQGTQGTQGIQGGGTKGFSVTEVNSPYSLQTSDVGNLIKINSGISTVSISSNTFSFGNSFMVYNGTSNTQTISQGVGVSFYSGDGTASGANKYLTENQMTTILCSSNNDEFIFVGNYSYYSNPEATLGTPTNTYNQLDTSSGHSTQNDDVVLVIDVGVISPSHSGCLFEIGGTGTGLNIGISSITGKIYSGAFTGSSWQASGQSWTETDITPYYGMSGSFILTVDYSAGTTNLYFTPQGNSSGNQSILLGSGSGGSSSVYGTNAAGCGTVSGPGAAAVLGFAEYLNNYTGIINEARLYVNASEPVPLQVII